MPASQPLLLYYTREMRAGAILPPENYGYYMSRNAAESAAAKVILAAFSHAKGPGMRLLPQKASGAFKGCSLKLLLL